MIRFQSGLFAEATRLTALACAQFAHMVFFRCAAAEERVKRPVFPGFFALTLSATLAAESAVHDFYQGTLARKFNAGTGRCESLFARNRWPLVLFIANTISSRRHCKAAKSARPADSVAEVFQNFPRRMSIIWAWMRSLVTISLGKYWLRVPCPKHKNEIAIEPDNGH